MHLILGQNNSDKYELTRFRQLYIVRYIYSMPINDCSNISHHGEMSKHVMAILTSFYVYLCVNFKLKTATFVRAYRNFNF
jgi:hypothetical protein